MSSAWVIYPLVGYSLPKGGVIPDVVVSRMGNHLKVGILRDLPLRVEPASHQLVGRVTAYQGDNG